MGYTPQQWADLNPDFPASAARFAYMEGGIKGNSDRLDALTPASIGALSQTAGDTRYAPNARVKSEALFPFTAAIAARNCDILVVGDSKSEGHKASLVTKRWIALLADDLRAQFNPAGVTGGYGYVPAWYASTYTTPPTVAWTFTGNVTPNSQEAGLGRRVAFLNATGASMSITAACTSFKLFFSRKNTSSDAVTVTIDGGAPTTVAITGTAGGPTTSGFTWSSGALTAGSHTIVVAWSGGSPMVEGGFFYNGDETSGIRIWDAAHSGYLANGFVDADAHAAKWQGAIPPIAPALTVIALGTNEHGTGIRTPVQFGSDLTNLVAAVRNKYAQTGVVLLVQNERGDSGATPVAPYAEYVQRAYSVAAADTGGFSGGSGVAVLDLTTRMPRGSSPDTYGLHADGIHFTDRGNRLVADVVLGFLTPA